MDLKRLDEYLGSDASPEESMLLSDLDGFLTGILCSPDLIMPSEWFPVVWGTNEPNVKDMDTHFWAIQAVLEHYNEIAYVLNAEPPHLEPIFWQAPEGHVIAMDWCEGFMQAVNMRHDLWGELLETKQGRDWMFPVFAHRFDDDGVSLSGINGPWQVSLAALSMLRSGDTEALEAYRVGDYSNPLVARYFQLRG